MIAKRKPGRPPKPIEERRFKNFTMRSLPVLFDKVKEAAERNGRSMAGEVEARLIKSFRDDEVLFALARIEAAIRRPEE